MGTLSSSICTTHFVYHLSSRADSQAQQHFATQSRSLGQGLNAGSKPATKIMTREAAKSTGGNKTNALIKKDPIRLTGGCTIRLGLLLVFYLHAHCTHGCFLIVCRPRWHDSLHQQSFSPRVEYLAWVLAQEQPHRGFDSRTARTAKKLLDQGCRVGRERSEHMPKSF